MIKLEDNAYELIENYKDGLSETFQSTAMMIHHIMEIAFSNYNLKSRIKTVQEDAIISLAEMVEYSHSLEPFPKEILP